MQDDYLAFQFRMALAFGTADKPEEVDQFAETRRKAEELRAGYVG